jgi:hypothetical protein
LAWKENTSNQLGKDADNVLKEFFEYADFDDAIKKWTPKLYDEIKGILHSRDNEDNPVCRTNNENGHGFTFASITMTFSETPSIKILAGPPDESEYERVDFTTKKQELLPTIDKEQ